MLTACESTCELKSERSRWAVTAPTATASTARITNTTVATLSASRTRIGSRDSGGGRAL